MEISFSIIMPTYNRRNCIKNAIDSLNSQTYKNFELIIIDDGSTDETKEYIESLYKKDILCGKIRYIREEENRGVDATRNIGLKMAKNRWILFLDTDNKMCPHYLETFRKKISENQEYKIFYAKMKNREGGGEVGRSFDKELFKNLNFIETGVFVFCREVYEDLGGFDEKPDDPTDWSFVIRYTNKYAPCFIDEILLDYYDGDDFERVTGKRDSIKK